MFLQSGSVASGYFINTDFLQVVTVNLLDRENCPKQPSSKCDGNAQALCIDQRCFVDQIFLDVILGELLWSAVLQVPQENSMLKMRLMLIVFSDPL